MVYPEFNRVCAINGPDPLAKPDKSGDTAVAVQEKVAPGTDATRAILVMPPEQTESVTGVFVIIGAGFTVTV
jgi:hypothetical protein